MDGKLNRRDWLGGARCCHWPRTCPGKLGGHGPATFALKLRVPGWSDGMAIRVNGQPQTAGIQPGQWATVSREWKPGDTLETAMPLSFRRVPIDEQHPNRVAIVRGPVVYAQEDPHKWLSDIPASDHELDKLMEAAGGQCLGVPDRQRAGGAAA